MAALSPLLAIPRLGALGSWGGGRRKQPSWSSSSLWAAKDRDTTVSCAKEGACLGESQSPTIPGNKQGWQQRWVLLLVSKMPRSSPHSIPRTDLYLCPSIRDRGYPATSSSKTGCQRAQTPLPHVVCDLGKRSLLKHPWPSGQVPSVPVVTSRGKGGWQPGP